MSRKGETLADFRVHSIRGGLIETTHEVVVAVVDAAGRHVVRHGDADLVTPIRSAAKPFQAFPLVADGVVDGLGISPEELALACASHNSEVHQVQLVANWMSRIGVKESDLVCGPHRPLAKEAGVRRRDGTLQEVELAPPSRVASNCSGKHTGMLALAKYHGWSPQGYALADHPVQQRCGAAIAEWFDLDMASLRTTLDGCGVVSWAVPLRAMALGYARASRATGPMASIVSAMTTHPGLVAGVRRTCTALMKAYPGRILAKLGAAGVYGAALLEEGLGIAIKVLDGNLMASGVALMAVLDALGLAPTPSSHLADYASPVMANTNGDVVGRYEASGTLSVV
ncbi:MAG: asparaginase [Gemmatimonadetes bacterium]|nr:asparaginase [Gemmatimonadota bacterium]